MLLFVARRLALLLGALLLTSMVIFALTQLLPGDTAQVMAGTDASPASVAAIRKQLGTDRPAVVQYADWLAGVVRGDFGRSVLNGSSVSGELGLKLSVTAPLVLGSTLLSVLGAVPLGIVAAARHRRADGVALSVLSQLGIALPTFWVGLMLVTFISVRWRILPSQGFPTEGWSAPADALRSLVLPVVTLALAQGAVLLRFVRSATLQVIHQDYMRTARAKGLTRGRALWRHGVRNAALPVVSVLGVQLASLLAGVVVIERVFTLPGVGQMLLKDVGARDLVKVQGTVLLTTALVLVIGFVIDIVLHLIDPRLRTS